MNTIGHAFSCAAARTPRRWRVAALRLATASATLFVGIVPTAQATSTNYMDHCSVCHAQPPEGPRLNAAGASGVILQANSNHGMGLSPAALAVVPDIATYIAGFTPGTVSAPAVGYRTTGNSITVTSLFVDRINGTPPAITGTAAGTLSPAPSSIGTGAFTGPALSISSPTITFNHAATNCNTVAFDVVGTTASNGNTTNRRVNVPITAPTVTANNVTVAAIPYSTSPTFRNIAGSITVSGNGSVPAGSLQLSGQSGEGTVTSSGTTGFNYTATGTTYSASVTVNYVAQGPCSTSSATRQITIPVTAPPAPTGGNLGPIDVPAGNGIATGINVSALLAGFRSASPLTVTAQPPAGQGTVTVTGPAQFTYTASGYSGPTSFTYTVAGPTGTGLTSVPYTVSLVPTDAPIVSPASATTAFNTAIAIDLAGSIAGSSTCVAVFGAATGGTAVASACPTSTITFTPTAGFIGNGTFQFTATGPGGTSPAPATVTVTVNPPPPTAAAATATIPFNSGNPVTSTSIDLAPFVTGIVTGVNASGAVNGTTSVSGTVVTFTPTVGYFGPASFSYTAFNAGGSSAPAPVALTVTPPPPPTASPLSVLVSSTMPTQFDLAPSITGSYSTLAFDSLPGQGTATLSGTMVTYTPTPGYIGDTIFIYRAYGLGGASAPATVTLTYTAAPVTSPRMLVVPYNTAGSIDLTSAFAGIVNSFSISKQPAHGTLQVEGTIVIYTPFRDYFGPDSFEFTATGPGGSSVPGVVAITVNPPAPVATGLEASVPFNTPTPIDLAPAAGGTASSFSISRQPANGTVVVSGSVATYTPRAGFAGADSFAFIASNATGVSEPAVVSITVGSLAPSATSTSMTVPLNGKATIDLEPFISGSLISGVAISDLPEHGLADVNGTKVTYTPRTNFFGGDRFTYVAYGDAGSSQSVVVTVTVVGRPDPSQDKNVVGLIEAQAQTARRFSRAQIGNFQRRLESLHAGPPAGDPASAPPAAPGPAAMAPDVAPARRPRAPAQDPFAGPAPASGLVPVSFPAADAPPKAASGFLQTALAGTLVSAATSKSVDMSTVTGGSASTGMQGGTSVWLGGLAHFGKYGATEGSSQLAFSTDGLSLGVDRRFSDRLVLGLGIGYGRDDTDIGTDGSRSKTTGNSFAVYGSYQPSRSTFVDAVVGAGSLDIDTNRYVESMDEFATGTRDGQQFFASVAAGYEFRKEGILISPYGRLDFATDKLKAMTETGAGLAALTFEEQTLRSTQGALGLRLETRQQTDYGWAVPRARIEYRHEFQDAGRASIRYADQFGGTVYSVTPAGSSRNSLLFGVGADFLWKRGLKLGIDYQGERNSDPGTVQAIRFLLSQDLDGRLPDIPWSWAWTPFSEPVGLEGGFSYDDNVSRGRIDGEKFSDQVYNFGLNASLTFPYDDNTRAIATGMLTVDKFHDYTGLGRTSGGLQGELQYRASGDFDSITYALFARGWIDGYESKLRSGLRATAGANARRSLTDRIDLFGEIGSNWRRAESAVFEGRDYYAKFNLDYSFGAAGIAYVAGEYRRGDTFASGLASIENLNLAEVFVRDDAFDRGDIFAYRFEGRTLLGTIGYNRPLGPRDSIDFSYRRVQTTPFTRPETGPSTYNVNQYSILYLMRF